MYASAKYLTYDSLFLSILVTHVWPHSSRKCILCGALTNGHEWIFLILYLNKDENGGTYTESPTIKIQASENYPIMSFPKDPISLRVSWHIGYVVLSFPQCALTNTR